jgi:cytochrome c biogenesis protein CcdA/DsbC/DsbD-like thiol-disulfide interchange protein
MTVVLAILMLLALDTSAHPPAAGAAADAAAPSGRALESRASGQDLPGAKKPKKEKPVVEVLEVRPEKAEVLAGEAIRVAFDLSIPKGWHIYPAGKKPLFGTPTVFKFEAADIAGKIEEPAPIVKKEEVVGDIDYHEGKITITVPVKLKAQGGNVVVKGAISYQICDPGLCIDNTTPFEFKMTVLAVHRAEEPPVQSVPDKPKLPFVKVRAVRPDKAQVKIGETVKVAIDLAIPAGYYIYPATKESTGKPTTFQASGVKRTDAIEEPAPKIHKSEGLDPYPVHEGEVTLTVPLFVEKGPSPGPFESKAKLSYQICNEENCFDNGTSFAFTLDVVSGDAVPVSTPESSETGFIGLILLGMLGGLISLVMPCTYPLIPITLTYFVKQAAGSRSHGLVLSTLYSLGIIITFTGLGFLMSVLLGAGGARTFAANPWVNITVASLFLWFAGSLFGWYEIQLPFGLGAKLAGGGQRKGAGGAFILGLLFAVVTFTCTIPIAGTILSVAAGGQRQFAALMAMLAYSVTMALPFFFMGLFPGMIREVPKAGGWLTTVKVSMGFIEVALACFYLSKADQAWDIGVLTRWVILSVYLGTFLVVFLYLLNFFRRPPTPLRIFFALAFLLQAGVVVYGLTGKPLGIAETIIPPPPIHGTTMPKALEEARKKGRPLFIEFTGVT